MIKNIYNKIKSTFWMRLMLFVLLGGIAGFAYYSYIGCYSGSCPITGNPYVSTSYGALMGLLLSYDSKRKEDKNNV